jgi:hypothetical protein
MGVAHLMPSHRAYQHPVFVNPPKYSKPFKPLAQDDIYYIDLEAEAFTDLSFPSRINLGQEERSDTLAGYGVHFTSPYGTTRAYLDSVTVMFVLTQISSTLPEEDNYLKIKVMESLPRYIFYQNNGDTIWFPVPNHAGPSGQRRAKDSVVIKNLADYLPIDPENPEYHVVTFKMNHKAVTTATNPDFYIEFLSAYDDENPDVETQNFGFLRGDDYPYPGFPYDFETQRTIGVPKSVENPDMTPETQWWQDLVPYAGITNQDHPEGFVSNAFIIAHVTDQANSVDQMDLKGDELAQNYPNPFNPSTQIAYSLDQGGHASLKVYNALGNEVATIFDEVKPAGKAEVTFDASDLPTGTYYYTLKCGAFSSTKRMVLSK